MKDKRESINIYIKNFISELVFFLVLWNFVYIIYYKNDKIKSLKICMQVSDNEIPIQFSISLFHSQIY